MLKIVLLFTAREGLHDVRHFHARAFWAIVHCMLWLYIVYIYCMCKEMALTKACVSVNASNHARAHVHQFWCQKSVRQKVRAMYVWIWYGMSLWFLLMILAQAFSLWCQLMVSAYDASFWYWLMVFSLWCWLLVLASVSLWCWLMVIFMVLAHGVSSWYLLIVSAYGVSLWFQPIVSFYGVFLWY